MRHVDTSPPDAGSAPDVQHLLLDLARLAVRAGASPTAGPGAGGSDLLERLVDACRADGGALLLVAGPTWTPEPEASTIVSPRHELTETAHVVALHGMTAEDAWWIAAARRYDEQMAPVAGGVAAHDSHAGHVIVRDYPLDADGRGYLSGLGVRCHALLALRWDTGGDALARRAGELLDTIADAVRAVLAAWPRAGAGEEPWEAPRDLTDREMPAAVADWEGTFDAISDPVAILTPEYRVLRANAAYRRAFGSLGERMEGHVCFARLAGEAGPCQGCPMPRTVATGEAGVLRRERWVACEDGGRERRVFQTWTYPVKDAAGRVARIVEIIKDVTAEDELRGAEARADAWREADRLKAELLGTVSHELRSPLAAIKGYADTLARHERRLPADERREFLRAISQASDRLERVIDQMLETSQLVTGGIRIDRVPLDAEELARAALGAAEREAEERAPGHFTFRLHVPTDRAPNADGTGFPPVFGDPARLREVLDRLLDNAVRYSPDGGEVSVEVRHAGDSTRADVATPVPARDPSVEIIVRDTGQGIPAEHLGRVFERFHRVDARLARSVDGLGLGLAICERIVEMHGGTIWAESEPGMGSAFHVRLPAGTPVPSAGAGAQFAQRVTSRVAPA